MLLPSSSLPLAGGVLALVLLVPRPDPVPGALAGPPLETVRAVAEAPKTHPEPPAEAVEPPVAAEPVPAADGAAEGAGAPDGTPAEAAARPAAPGPLLAARFEDRPDLVVPRDEELVYEVEIGLGLVEMKVGKVTLSSGVEPFHQGSVLFVGEAADEGLEQGWMRAHAKGKYGVFYSMDTTIESRVLPQGWPRSIYRYDQKGTEGRRRMHKTGVREGRSLESYRYDTKNGAPPGTRIWVDFEEREIPERHYDMLSAVYVMRTMLLDGRATERFALIDKMRVWDLRITRGETETVEVPAGRFQAVHVLLEAQRAEGETWDSGEKFKGLFGLHGGIRILADARSGVPVRIQGDLPIGIIDLNVDIRLLSYRGTPASFAPLPE